MSRDRNIIYDLEDTKISMVVAIYNSEKFLDKLIRSVMGQTHQNFELILVDDGSPDNSGALCDGWAKKDNRIAVIHKENGGTCDARNKGMEAAKGDYLMITDGDDWLEPDYMEYLLKLVIENDADMAMTDQIFTTRDRQQVDNDKIEILTPEEASTNIIYPRIPIGPWNKIFKIDMIRRNNLNFSVPWSGEGLYFTCMAAQYSNRVVQGHRKIYDYRLNNAGSGLTNYNVQLGINALWNIKNIGKITRIRSDMFMNAIQWHIWKNYNWLLMLILATNSEESYMEEYRKCLIEIRRMLPNVILQSDFPMRSKVKMVVQGLFPKLYAKRIINNQKRDLSNDKME